MSRVFSNELLLGELSLQVSQGKSVKIRVRGNSMRPFLYENRDEVIVSPFQEKELNPGLIVLALLPDSQEYVLHRIWKRKGNLLVLRGDGNVRQSENCEVKDVKGCIHHAIRNGSFVDFESSNWQWRQRFWNWLLPLRRYLLAAIHIMQVPAYLFTIIKKIFTQ